MDIVYVVLLAGVAAAASVAGGLLALWHRPTTLSMSLALGFAAGVLLGVVSFEMVPRCLELGSLPIALGSLLIGFGIVYALDLFINRGRIAGEWAAQRERVQSFHRSRRPLGGEALVFAAGTTLEEIVEGLAIGVGAAIEPDLAAFVAATIAVDNFGEGLSIGELVRTEREAYPGQHLRRVLFWTGLIGVIVIVQTLVGWSVLRGVSPSLQGFMFGVPAGGMLYLAITELVPGSQKRHFQQSAGLATLGGVLIVMVLATVV